MTRSYNERRNKQIFVLVDRRKVAPKDVPAALLALGFGIITYSAVRQILSRGRIRHNLSQNVTSK